ncbi:Protein of unknown function [Micromonospora lupini str. Lupac 08]|uniref:Membrane transport protein MMPL domain-containing protein n=1 Tax=Micromonospora lupini str. Lupac 08 TaxID=1150864 RepID=I0KXF4_9ACTN|nr:Protein of unknown function [Micromonospora lupini str. Lupac 08]
MGKAWWVIAGWVLAAAAIILTTPSLSAITSADQESFLPRSYESVQATELGQKAFPQQATATAIIVVKRADGQKLTPADEARVGQLAQSLKAKNIPHTTGYLTSPPAVAPDKVGAGGQRRARRPGPRRPGVARRRTRSARGHRPGAGEQWADRGRGRRRGELRRQRGHLQRCLRRGRRRDDHPDHRTNPDHLPQPHRRAAARGGRRRRSEHHDGSRRRRGQGIRSQCQSGSADDPADRVVRHRHRLHLFPALPPAASSNRMKRWPRCLGRHGEAYTDGLVPVLFPHR